MVKINNPDAGLNAGGRDSQIRETRERLERFRQKEFWVNQMENNVFPADVSGRLRRRGAIDVITEIMQERVGYADLSFLAAGARFILDQLGGESPSEYSEFESLVKDLLLRLEKLDFLDPNDVVHIDLLRFVLTSAELAGWYNLIIPRKVLSLKLANLNKAGDQSS